MKKLLIILYLFISFTICAQTNVELIGKLNGHPSAGYNDIWGYVDSSGIEYALLGVRNGTSIIDLADPSNPVEVAFIPGTGSVWRDIKVHQNYAYVVSDATNDGLQIIDLSYLPDSAILVNTVKTYFVRAHNIFIDNGYAYIIGTENGGGMHILDLSNPTNPVRTDYYTESGYIHDVYVWNDTVVACAEDSYDLVDVTDKSNPVKISESIELPGIYAHSGWMTEDKRYFYGTEEFNQRDITVWDLQDRTTWDLVVPTWENESNSIVHNLFIKGDYAHISYYTDGYVVLDISDPEAPFLIGEYDINPSTSGTSYNEAWGCYPFLPSGLTLISSMEEGLFVLKFIPGDIPPTINHTGLTTVLTTDPVVINPNIVDNGEIVEANLFYRTTSNENTSDWNLISSNMQTNDYEFVIPGFEHLTEVEYYLAALDDSNKVTTLPIGGSGKNPAGSNPPPETFKYTVVISGPPSILSFYPLSDTSVTVTTEFDFSVYAEDTTGLELNFRWLKNGSQSGFQQTYHYRAGVFPTLPRVDTIEVIVSNGYYTNSKVWAVNIQQATDVKDGERILSYELEQNYPNPFNPSTQISFAIPGSEFVNLSVYNLIGEKVTELVNENLPAGKYDIQFKAGKLTSGIYIARIKSGSFDKMIKMILMK